MRTALTLALVLLAAAAAAAEAPEIANTAPVLDPVTLQLEELWRRGGEDDDVMIGLPVEAMSDPEGHVYLADQQLCQAFVFGPDGELVKTLGRQGEGPGEVSGPVDMVRFPDGTIGLAEFFPGRITKIAFDGEPAGQVTVDVGGGATGGFTIQTMAEMQGQHLLMAGSRSVPGEKFTERVHFLAAIGPDGKQTVRYMEQVSHIQRPHSVVHENDFVPAFPLASALGPDGRVYTPADREHYAVNVFLPDGTLEKVITRPGFETWKRDKRDMRRITALFESWAGQNPATWPRFDLEDTERAITALHIDGQGRLWVQHSRSNRDVPDGVFLRFDLYDADGAWQREVSFACEGNPVSDGVRFLRDGRVLLIKGFVVARLACLGTGAATLGDDETETIEIVCYRLPEV